MFQLWETEHMKCLAKQIKEWRGGGEFMAPAITSKEIAAKSNFFPFLLILVCSLFVQFLSPLPEGSCIRNHSKWNIFSPCLIFPPVFMFPLHDLCILIHSNGD